MKRIFITGTAGFIGFHLAKLLLEEGWIVHGFDGITEYYDVALKKARNKILKQYVNFVMTEAMLEDMEKLSAAAKACQPDVIVHLAAQAGVRYSIKKPRSYVESNIVGTFNVMEIAREHSVDHLLMASTSSVYGANNELPFTERQKADTQVSFYAATKKANEVMAHSWSHIHGIPITMFRFFTVYGPWGRPDMAPHLFAEAIRSGKPIKVFNNGEMWRDFTYVSDIVQGIRLLIDHRPESRDIAVEGDSLSPVSSYRVVNIGNGEKIWLEDFIKAIEDVFCKRAIRDYQPIQQGDVTATWADTSLFRNLTGFSPKTSLNVGLKEFADWHLSYYEI